MNFRKLCVVGFILVFVAAAGSSVVAQTKMTKEEWQKAMTDYTAQRDNLKKTLAQLTKDVDSLKALLASLNQKIESTVNETRCTSVFSNGFCNSLIRLLIIGQGPGHVV